MDSLLKGIPGVIAYLDDILITVPTEAEHLKAQEEVLARLERAGLRVQENKCLFNVPSVSYLGYNMDREGLHPVSDKVKVVEAPTPQNVQELKSYLGLLSYYGRFLPNLSSVMTPL